MANLSTNSQKNELIVLTAALVGIILLNIPGLSSFFSTITTTVFQPPALFASSSAKQIKSFFNTISEVSTLRSDYAELELKYYEASAMNSLISLILEENTALKTQLLAENIEAELLEAEVLSPSNEELYDSLIINRGKADGIKIGDIVVLGNVYVGSVVKVEETVSKVRLPISRATFLKVIIVAEIPDQLICQVSENEDPVALDIAYADAVLEGSEDGLKLENIVADFSIEPGMSVIVNDEKVGRYLLVGTVGQVENDPALTSQQATVDPVYNYLEQKFVFVIKSKE